jgi:hypothetical protein
VSFGWLQTFTERAGGGGAPHCPPWGLLLGLMKACLAKYLLHTAFEFLFKAV